MSQDATPKHEAEPQPGPEPPPAAEKAPTANEQNPDDEAPLFKGQHVWQRRWFQMMLAALVVFLVLSYVVPGVLGLLYAVRSVLVPVLIGLALAYIVNPVLRFAQRRLRIGRLAGTISLMLIALVLVAVMFVTAVPLMISQGRSLVQTVQEAYPRYVDKLLAQIENTAEEVGSELQAEQDTAEAEAETRADATTASGRVETEAEPDATADTTGATAPQTDADTAEEAGTPADREDDASTGEASKENGGEADHAAGQTAMDKAVDEAVAEAIDRATEPAAEGSLVERIINPDRNRQLLELSVERLRQLDGRMIMGWALQSLDVGVGLVGSAVSFTSYLVLSGVVVAFCFFFFSWKLDDILRWFEPFIPARSHDQIVGMLRNMDSAVSSFVRGRVIQSLVMTVVLVIGWWLAGVPYWFLLGVLTGVLNLVPFLPAVGWIVAVVLTVMATLANGGDFALGLILWPTVAYFAAQGLDGWVVEPVVQGQATNLDPLTVMLVVLGGGAVAGLLGMLLAIPLAACVKILAREMLLPKLRSLASEA